MSFSFDSMSRPDEVEIDLPPWMKKREFVLVRSVDQLHDLVDQAIAAGIVAIDTETEGLDLRVYGGKPMHGMAGFSFSCDPMVGYYVPTGHYAPWDEYNLPVVQALAELERMIEGTETWWFNAGFDHEVLFLAGLPNRLFLHPVVKTSEGSKVIWEDWGTAYDFIWSNLKRNRLKDASVHLLDPEVDPQRVSDVLHELIDDDPDPTAEELIAWMKKRLVHPVHRHSQAGLIRRFPKFGQTLKPLKLKKLFDTVTFRMIELDQLFTPEDFLRSGNQLNFAYLCPDGLATKYAASDAIVTLMIGRVMREHPHTSSILNWHGGFVYRLERQIVPPMRLMTRHRILIDRKRLTAYRDQGREETDALALEIKGDMVAALQLRDKADLAAELKAMDLTTFLHDVLHNPAGLAKLTYDEIGVPTEGIERTGSGEQWSTKADQFDILAEQYGDQYPFVRKVSTWRSYDKLVSNPLDMLSDGGSPDALCGVHDEDDEARFPVRSLGAPTGRMSSGGGRKTNNPKQGMTGTNALAIPAGKNPKMPLWVNNIRDGFMARPGYVWVSIDFSGEELRIAANLTQEEAWVEEFVNGSGDMHSVVARDVYGIPSGEPVPKDKRSKAKNFNFASLYGGGIASYIRTIGAGSMSPEEAGRRLKEYYQKNPRTKAFHDRQFALAKKKGCIYTPYGRRCPVPDAAIDIDKEVEHLGSTDARNMTRAYKRRIKASKRDAINYVIQGAGADILKMAILFTWQKCRKKGWITDERDWRNDAVKFLLPVHDEINFEVREDILVEAIDVIVDAMLYFQRLKTDWPVPFSVDVTVGPNWKRQVAWGAVKKASQYAPTEKDKEKGGYVCWPDGTIITDDKGAFLPEEFQEYIFKLHRLAAEQLGEESKVLDELPPKLVKEEPEPEPEPEPSVTDYPEVEGGVCEACGKTQYETPHGAVCVNGHGGAATVPREEYEAENRSSALPFPEPVTAAEAADAFHGETYDPDVDFNRLRSEVQKVAFAMWDGQERSASELVRMGVSSGTAGATARLRDLRKHTWGPLVIHQRRNEVTGVFLYRLDRTSITKHIRDKLFQGKPDANGMVAAVKDPRDVEKDHDETEAKRTRVRRIVKGAGENLLDAIEQIASEMAEDASVTMDEIGWTLDVPEQPERKIEGKGTELVPEHVKNAVWHWLQTLQDYVVEEDGEVRFLWVIKKAEVRARAQYIAKQLGIAKIMAPGRVPLDLRTEEGEDLLEHLGGPVSIDPLPFLILLTSAGL